MLIKEQINANQNSLLIGPISFPSSSKLLQLVFFSIASLTFKIVWNLINNGLLNFSPIFLLILVTL